MPRWAEREELQWYPDISAPVLPMRKSIYSRLS